MTARKWGILVPGDLASFPEDSRRIGGQFRLKPQTPTPALCTLVTLDVI